MDILLFQKILDKGEEGFEVIPDTQFSVSRTANKDNSSHYEVDGKRRVFKGQFLSEDSHKPKEKTVSNQVWAQRNHIFPHSVLSWNGLKGSQ